MRQNTPHPKELKAKAHKLFGGKGKPSDEKTTGDDEEGNDKGLYRKIPDNYTTFNSNNESRITENQFNDQSYDENDDDERLGGGDELHDNDIEVFFIFFQNLLMSFGIKF